MSIIITEAKKEITRLESMKRIVDEFQEDEPIGCLKYQKRKENVYFYQQYKNESTKRSERKFINKENIALARRLAQKQYYSFLKPIIENNLKILKLLVKQYSPEQIDTVYDDLSIERKNLITPIPGSKEERIRKWNEEHRKKEENSGFEVHEEFYPEGLKYATEQGEYVRSKSEVIIANMLYQYRNDLMYIYEWPLDLRLGNRIITFRPDFKIMNIHTGKITYWEHAGLMDDSDYVADFVRKVNTYISNDLMVGRDVVFTYETSENPLDISVIKRMVEELRKL